MPSAARSTVYVPPQDGTESTISEELDQLVTTFPLSVASQSSFNPFLAYKDEAVTVNALPLIEYATSPNAEFAAIAIIATRHAAILPPPIRDDLAKSCMAVSPCRVSLVCAKWLKYYIIDSRHTMAAPRARRPATSPFARRRCAPRSPASSRSRTPRAPGPPGGRDPSRAR